MANMNEYPVALYGAGVTVLALFKVLSRRYNIVCFCDSDKRKQGGQFLGLPVFSWEEVVAKHPDLHVYVSTNDNYKFEIMETLIRGGFPKERIVNYEPYRKYVSCHRMECRIGFAERVMCICTCDFGKYRTPIISYTNNPAENVQKFIRIRDSVIDMYSSDARENPENQGLPCIGCPELKERYWAVNRRFTDICLSIKHKCNFKCSYCVEQKIDKCALIGNEHLDEALETMRFMDKNGLFDEYAVLNLAPTEIAIHPYRDKILEMTEKYVRIFVSNASVYVDAIAASLARGGRMLTSLDAGTPETFKKIKGVDMFNRVCDNLKRYAKAGEVEVKYIFLPDVNDNETDVDGFITACKIINPSAVNITRDIHIEYDKHLPKHTKNMIARMMQKANDEKLHVNFSSQNFHDDDYKYVQQMIGAATH